MIDLGGGVIYRLAKDFINLFRSRKSKLSSAEIVALREKWKKEFEGKYYERKKSGLRSDVIIRDVNRIDSYPDVTEAKKGISPWFKVGFGGTYHRGILAGLSWEGLLHKDGSWMLPNREDSSENLITAALLGYIPYENIVSVDWDGDEFYGHPQIYCYFDARNGEPYEKVVYCERKEHAGAEWYSELASYEEVRKNSKMERK